jgi:hypothetical protein
VHDGDVIKARGRERQVKGRSHVFGAHGGTQLPGHDVTREVVERDGDTVSFF